MSLDNILLPLVAILAVSVLLRSPYSRRDFWHATVTPLASIIGSGFLIVAPLLAMIGGHHAIWLMLALVCFAYAVGGVIRFNIAHVEPALNEGNRPVLTLVERISNVALSFAYIISITFYLRLLSSFVLSLFALEVVWPAQLLTTLILLFIGLVGWRRGLGALEQLENISVTIKLAIIGSLLLALFHYDWLNGFTDGLLVPAELTTMDRLRMLGGMLLVGQGFETSRYLGHKYPASTRIQSMKLAQGLSAVIYLLFVWLMTPLMHYLPYDEISETAIITLSSYVVAVLPFMLIIAATMSQFSAAVGDTIGAGGLIEEESRHKLPERPAYLLIAGLAIMLVWFADIFEIVSLASRAFALYYLLQALLAFRVTMFFSPSRERFFRQLMLLLMAAVLLLIVVFAIPVG